MNSASDRDLDWKGVYNARDLGGLPTAAGGTTRRGTVFRSDSLQRLAARGGRKSRPPG